MQLRRSNLEGLLETGLIKQVEFDVIQIHDDGSSNTTKAYKFVTDNPYFLDEEEVDEKMIITLCEIMASANNVVFQFSFLPMEHEFPWQGGIYSWQPAIPFPTNEEEAEKLKGTPISRFEGPWLLSEPDIPVFDRDMGNLMAQLLIALHELYASSGND